MGVYRHTLIFDGLGHGASETLYYTLPAPSTVTSAFTALADIKNKRALLLGKEWQIKGERIEQVVDDDGVKRKGIGSVAKLYLPGVKAQPSCESNISLQVQFSDATSFHKKLMFMVGCPRSLFPNGDALDLAQTTEPGQWMSNFNSWKSLIRGLGASWYTAPNVYFASILNYVVDFDTGITTYTLSSGITWPNDNKPIRVSVEFPTKRSPLDGVQLVIKTTATEVYTALPRPAGPFTVQGGMWLKGAVLATIGQGPSQGPQGNIVPQNPVTRKRGRPLLVSRGRQAVTVRW